MVRLDGVFLENNDWVLQHPWSNNPSVHVACSLHEEEVLQVLMDDLHFALSCNLHQYSEQCVIHQ